MIQILLVGQERDCFSFLKKIEDFSGQTLIAEDSTPVLSVKKFFVGNNLVFYCTGNYDPSNFEHSKIENSSKYLLFFSQNAIAFFPSKCDRRKVRLINNKRGSFDDFQIHSLLAEFDQSIDDIPVVQNTFSRAFESPSPLMISSSSALPTDLCVFEVPLTRMLQNFELLAFELKDDNKWQMFSIKHVPVGLLQTRYWNNWLEFETFNRQFAKKVGREVGTRVINIFFKMGIAAAQGTLLEGPEGAIGGAAFSGALNIGINLMLPIFNGVEKIKREKAVQKIHNALSHSALGINIFPNWPGYYMHNVHTLDEPAWRLLSTKMYFKPPKSDTLNLHILIYPNAICIKSDQIADSENILKKWTEIWDVFAMWPMLDYLYFNDVFFSSSQKIIEKSNINKVSYSQESDPEYYRQIRFDYLGRHFFLDEFFEKILPNIEIELNAVWAEWLSYIRENPVSIDQAQDQKTQEIQHVREVAKTTTKIANVFACISEETRDFKSSENSESFLPPDSNTPHVHDPEKLLFDFVRDPFINPKFKAHVLGLIYKNMLKELEGFGSCALSVRACLGAETAIATSVAREVIESSPLGIARTRGISLLSFIFGGIIIDGIFSHVAQLPKARRIYESYKTVSATCASMSLCAGTFNFIAPFFNLKTLPDTMSEMLTPHIGGFFGGPSPILFLGDLLTDLSTNWMRDYLNQKNQHDILKIVDKCIVDNDEENDFFRIQNPFKFVKEIAKKHHNTLYRAFPRELRHLFIDSKSLTEIYEDIKQFKRTYKTQEGIRKKYLEIQREVSASLNKSAYSSVSAGAQARAVYKAYEHMTSNQDFLKKQLQRHKQADISKINHELHKLYLFIYYSRKYRFLLKQNRKIFLDQFNFDHRKVKPYLQKDDLSIAGNCEKRKLIVSMLLELHHCQSQC